MGNHPKIVVVGSANVDMVVKIGRLPRPGETVLGGVFRTAAGGKGANQAVSAARAGGNVAFIARVGNDSFGTEALTGYVECGIDTEHVRRSLKHPTGVALIVVDEKGENSIAVASGANAELSVADIRRASKTFEEAGMLLLQMESPLETVREAVRQAARIGVPVILNPAPVPAGAVLDDLFPLIDVLTPNVTEAGMLARMTITSRGNLRKAAGILLEKMTASNRTHLPERPAVLITLGPKGVFVAAPGIETTVPGFKVRAVDTTAAGDVFNGALAVALAEGRPMLEAVRFAAAAAAISVTRMGAQPSAPWRAEISRLMNAPRRKVKP